MRLVPEDLTDAPPLIRRIVELMAQKRITGRALATRIGKSPSYMATITSGGNRNPGTDVIAALSRELGEDLFRLLDPNEVPQATVESVRVERDFEADPYDRSEARIAKALAERTGIGGGDDPVGFVLVAMEALAADRRRFSAALKRIAEEAKDPKIAAIARDATG